MKPLPKSLQLSEMLIREIASGKLPDGTRLPPEREFADTLGVAVGTLRKALALLEDKALLRRVQGSGNYIQARSDIDSVYTFFRLERLEGGGLPTASLLSVDREPRPLEATGFVHAHAHRIRRLRYLDEDPIALEEIWLDARFSDQIEEDALSESLYYYYKQALGLIISSAEDRVGLDTVPSWAPPSFACSPGSVSGYIERQAKSQDGRAAEYSRTWFNPARARYVMRLK